MDSTSLDSTPQQQFNFKSSSYYIGGMLAIHNLFNWTEVVPYAQSVSREFAARLHAMAKMRDACSEGGSQNYSFSYTHCHCHTHGHGS